MNIQIKAVFENGVFRPLQPVRFSERQEVTITCEGDSGNQIMFALSPERWKTFCDALDDAPRQIPSLQKLLTEVSVLDGNIAPTAGAD